MACLESLSCNRLSPEEERTRVAQILNFGKFASVILDLSNEMSIILDPIELYSYRFAAGGF